MSCAATARQATTRRHPSISADGMWYWNGRHWKSTTSSDGQWRWDGYRWTSLRAPWARSQVAKRSPTAGVLLGLLALDLIGFFPGAFPLSVAAALALVFIDGRGLVSLNGLIKWRRLSFGMVLVGAFLEVLLFQFVVAIYLVQRLLGMTKAAWTPRVVHPSSPAVIYEGTVDLPAQASPKDAEAMKSALDRLVADASNRLPGDLLEKLRAVVAAIVEVLPAYAGSELTAHDRFIVERTVDDYLPSALNTYLKLPMAYRTTPLRDADGKTADQVLSEQLDLLLQRMTQVTDVAFRKDVEAFLVHGRFLRSKFGPSSLSLKS